MAQEPVATNTNSSEIVVGGGTMKGELEVFSPTWIYVCDHINGEIQRLREKNDSVSADPIKTAVTRGEIKALKGLIDLPNEQKRRGLMAPVEHDE